MGADGLTRPFDILPSQYTHIALLLSTLYRKTRPYAYMGGIVGCDNVSNIKSATGSNDPFVPILTSSAITGYHAISISAPTSDNIVPVTSLSYVHIMLHSALPLKYQDLTSEAITDGVGLKMTSLASDVVVNWICVYGDRGSFLA